jgi:hypothetical protein
MPNCWRGILTFLPKIKDGNSIWQTALMLWKDIPIKKRVHLQLFGIIHLSNLNLTYIRNLDRETPLCLRSSTSQKFTSEILLYYLLFVFLPPSCLEPRCQLCVTRVYFLAGGSFFQVSKKFQVFCQTVGEVFLMFLPKIKDDNCICQIVGDALENTPPIVSQKTW